MASLIFEENSHTERVRALLGVATDYLPDNVINSPDFLALSEMEIIKIVPNYEELEGEDRLYFESAIIYDLGARLCPSMKNRLPKKSSGVHFQSELSTDWDKMRAMLLFERDRFISSISGYEGKASFRFGLTFKD